MRQRGDEALLSEVVLEQLAPELRASLSPAQRQGLRRALDAPTKHRRIDLRFTVPLGFTRYYVVFLMGRDRRAATQDVEQERRRSARVRGSHAGLAVSAIVTFLATASILYIAKSAAGIDVFNWHLSDLMPR